MNKKQKNRKLVKQNKRNRIVNRRYVSTIKNLFKLIKNKLKILSSNLEIESEKELKLELKNLMNSIYSIIDKSVKKNVLHKNNAARKKSTIYFLLKTKI
jgi:small subunit ribosomal protein S20